MIQYTQENIEKLEEVYKIMMQASDITDTAKKNAEIMKAGELLKQVGLIQEANDPKAIVAAYNEHVLGRIREIVKKTQEDTK